MKRLLPLAFAIAAVAIYFPRVSAQRPLFTTGTPAELAQARSLGLERLRALGLAKGIEGADDLVVSSAHVDRRSMAHARVQQRFHGIPVLRGEAIAHLNSDGSRFAETDTLIAGISVNTTPQLTAAAAIDIATTDYGCRTCLTATPTADLWIVRDDAGVDHLTYRVQMTRMDGSNETALPVRFVDAHGGYVVLGYDNLQTGTGNSLYSGTVTIGTSFNGTAQLHVMENLTRRVGTFDLRNAQGGTVFRFLDGDDVWDATTQRAGVDAHYGAEKYLDYLQSVHGRNGIDGAGGPFFADAHDGSGGLISAIVHFGVNYNNAFWDSFNTVMIYGDGDGAQFGPLVALDIAGHEMTHGLTQFTAGLVYQGESGALNESWSDVFGAMTERHVRGESTNTWRIGEQAYTPGTPDDALRYMDDPHLAPNVGFTADDDPDHYNERYTGSADNGGVHINSGIANKAFYLLAKGGTHHLGGAMTGIGADAAAQIWFTALRSYMTSGTNFLGARDATLLAAAALYGSNSTEQQAVARAWCLVGVGTCVTVGAVSVSPNAGAGATQSFTLQYSDSAGAVDLSSARVRFATSSGQAAGTCSAWYDATTATIKLMNDGGTWGAPVSLGIGTLSNSQCTLNLASSAATPNGTNLTLVLNITFSGSFSGQKNIYMLAGSASAPSVNSGWIQRGTWNPVGLAAVSVGPDAAFGSTQAFTLHFSDSLGASDLTSARVRFGASNVGPGTCTAWYDAAAASIRLMNDAGVWGSPVPLGSGTLSNGQCTLNLASSTATLTGPDLVLVLNVTFTASFAGQKNIYMLAGSAGGANTGWQQRGTYTVLGSGPQAISVWPNVGTGSAQMFTLEYSDSNGAAALTSARVRFGASNVGPGTCSAWYDASTATITLMNDGGVWGNPVPLGNGTLANSQCTLNLATSSATPSGNDLTLELDIAFSGTFAGQKQIYMLAGDATTTTPWQQRGTWTVPTPGPATISVTPNSGSGITQAFSLLYSNTNGATDLTSARVRFAASNVGPNTCTARYDATTGVIELLNDAGTTWAAGTWGSGALSNSQCTLNLASSSATPNGTNLTLVLNITFSVGFAGAKNVYMLAASSDGANTGWQQRGTWTVPLPAVSAVSATPNSGSGVTQAFTMTYSDSFGAADLLSARVRFGASNVGPGTCTASYNAITGAISLLDDAGTNWTAGTMGSGTLSNSQCTLNLAGSSATPDGTTLTVVLNITFAGGFSGLKNVYMLAQSNAGPNSGWQQRGTWTVPSPNPTTMLFLDSETGDWVGQGQEHTYTPIDGTFSISRTTHNGIRVSVTGPGLSFWWFVTFNAQDDADLQVGSYLNATRWPFTSFVGMDASGDGRGCNQLTGRFNVLEVVYGAGGNVERFAADFEQHCEDAAPALFGAIRYNSTIPAASPFNGNYPSYRLHVAQPASGRVTGGGINCGTGGQACDVSFGVPTNVMLTATPDAGFMFGGWTGRCSGAATIVVNVNTEEDCAALFLPVTPPQPRTAMFWNSHADHWVGRGRRDVFVPANSHITATPINDDGVTIAFDSVVNGHQGSWVMIFSAPTGQNLIPGTYTNAARFPASGIPGMDIFGDGAGCNATAGSFVVHEVEFDGGTLSKLALDYEHHCETVTIPGKPLIGSIRYNSDLPQTASLALTFTGQGQVTISSSGKICTFNCTDTAIAGTATQLTAQPAAGWLFMGWSGDSDCTNGSLTLIAPMACHATFQQISLSAAPETNVGTSNRVMAVAPRVSENE